MEFPASKLSAQRIPTVTEVSQTSFHPALIFPAKSFQRDDLTTFHSRHFPAAPFPITFFRASHQDQDLDEHDGDANDDKSNSNSNDACTYPDGVQRYLTDAQVSIFRHSEIQALLKERRRLAEMELSDPVETLSQEDEEVTRAVEPDPPRKMATLPEITPARTSGHRSSSSSAWAKKKVKNKRRRVMAGEAAGDEGQEEFTPRRIAREQDEARDVPVELDY